MSFTNLKQYNKEYILDDQEISRIEVIKKIIGKGNKVLDLGSREGHISEVLRNMGNDVDCIEIHPGNISLLRKKGFKVYDCDLNTEWADKMHDAYDIVFAGEVIEHLFQTDIFLENVYKVLKPNGIFVITTPNTASLGRRLLLLLGKNPALETSTRENEAGHIRYFVYPSLKKILEENKFKVINHCSDIVNLSYSGKLSSRVLAKLFPCLGRSIILKTIKN